jgi:hypothetical protein
MAADLPSNYRSLNANQKLLRSRQSQTQVRDIAKTSRPADLYQIGAQASGIITSRNQPQCPSHPRSPAGYPSDRSYLPCRHPAILWTLPRLELPDAIDRPAEAGGKQRLSLTEM